jgi:hypothetical protein
MRKILIAVLCILLSFGGSVSASQAKGKHNWWETSANKSWLANGIICYEADSKVKVGNKMIVSTKLGQSKTFKKIDTIFGISGDTLVDLQNGAIIDPDNPVDDEGNPIDENGNVIDASSACNNGVADVAFISNYLPNLGGSHIVRFAQYTKAGKFLWNDDEKVLVAALGIDSGTSFFTSPPKLSFSSTVLSSLRGIKAYTNSGAPRNACLIVYDIVLKGSRTDGSTYARDIVSSAQNGYLGVSLRSYLGGTGVQVALKCASWIGDYIW